MLQYQTEIDQLVANTGVTCPPNSAKVRKIVAWRWVFKPMTAQCFFPVAVRNPKKLLQLDAPRLKCSAWGLSMHISKEHSIAAFHALEESFDRIRKVIGTHVAVGELSAAHGVATSADSYGHFDLHPKVSAPFHTTFVVEADPIPEFPDD